MNEHLLSNTEIADRIYIIRGHKVMLDKDLAELYDIETKLLKRQVKRNLSRFPQHYMFELTSEEQNSLRYQNGTLKRGEHSKYLSYAFSEHGILMLANVLKSDTAIKVSIRIIDIFVELRNTINENTEIWLAIERIKGRLDNQDKNMEIVFRYLDELSQRLPLLPEPGVKKRMGYKPED